ncbi:MAG: Gfo/Idh/MocA family oxidoreductase [bacterium]|nr:Gfo/Idh/MocA family oxidoreductase [bacterium]
MRVGIIGCGVVSEGHIHHIRRITGVEIVGVCDTDKERAQEISHRFGIRHIYRDAVDMLKERVPDVVHILTPPDTHKELSIQAMEAGCHVLVEKPMALNVKEADEMIAASRHHRVTLGICHNHLFDPAVLEAKELVARGAIGRVIAVETFWMPYLAGNRYRTTQWIYELPGGIFHEVAPHPVYLLMEFLKTSRVVSALSKKTGSDLPTTSDELRVLFDGESGQGSLSISLCANPYLVFLNIYGTDMSIRVDIINNTLVKFKRSGLGKISKALVNIDHSLQLLSKTITNTIGTLQGRRTLGHGILIEKFYESLRKGTDPPVTGEDGRAAVAVLDQIWAKLGLTHARREGA